MHPVKINPSIIFGQSGHFVLIAGPCVIENEASALRHAEKISKIARDLKMPYVFKASFDKANRSSHESFRGPGLEKGLRILAKVKREVGVPILSDVHETHQVEMAAEVLDILQIPAFLCRQTDLLIACGRTKKIVNVKKGQFMAPWDMKNSVKKIESTGNHQILITERGVSFGYNNLVSDFRAIPVLRSLGYPVVFDATHSVQIPGGLGHASGGEAEFIPVLSRCAVASGADALFMEVHENPKKAKSDGPNNLALKDLKPLLKTLKRIRQAAPFS
ncbi:MAG: 3-deoxy-8-phosphooctulonate synthase [Candidatus Omnitrophica bacterium CG11_big_fil_rev_8_21_14_0_20_45_26]|uniref:2-dehydro-3-deoxyphosphooctonate aldolase n=1 Tax=Candidatus Abzuiibacterium crystallinum TaxID=1974748 RepID=A0A2H0LMQ0_9BACT|nr:MAG: 3-deoxy-8-phosphooctulonate synthase [Candidatus Omnitrophica bacterium CG11_big_fil_rev_8_21_14_0_20_45_26]PIW65205.1 MAG: 3-deoxy-8-phosphooctulonate synthase [Candidatus Omnitrophica bacterium CG12_big_fil_rev_8_21_14_0_65_45_16]